MRAEAYDLARFIRELSAITAGAKGDAAIIQALRPLVRQLALSRAWLQPSDYECDPNSGFTAHVLHEAADQTAWVVAVSWLPGRGAPPHNHGTWAVVAGVEGPEKNVYWKRVDDGSRPGHAELSPIGEEVVAPGDVVAFLPDAIHSVRNETDRVTVSLHVYGRNLNRAGRSQFDPEKRTESPFIIPVQ